MTIGFYNENTSKNAPYIRVNGVIFYFSYETVVAVSYGMGLKITKNQWSTTTGKHLNWINDDHSMRLSSEGFEKEIKKACAWAGIDELPLMRI